MSYPFSAPNAVFVVGPTASGKSDLALRLAHALGGTVISADSMQIYRGLDIGTAKESEAHRRLVPHEMIDVADPEDEFSVAKYRDMALEKAQNAMKDGRIPVFAGGTGLYFEALFYPMNFAGADKDPALRASLMRELDQKGAAAMHARLAEVDPPTAARLHINDTKRIIRALEIAESSGRPMSALADEKRDPDVIAVGLAPADRNRLYEKINARTEKMFASGLVEEVASLKVDLGAQSMQAIGYKEFAPYAERLRNGGSLTPEELAGVKEKIKQNTRRYAKRQLTWFRRYSFVHWFESSESEKAYDFVLERLGRQGSGK